MNFCVFRRQCFVRVIILASFQEEKYLILFLVSSLFESVESIQELFTKFANVYNCTFEQQMHFRHFDQVYFFLELIESLVLQSHLSQMFFAFKWFSYGNSREIVRCQASINMHSYISGFWTKNVPRSRDAVSNHLLL